MTPDGDAGPAALGELPALPPLDRPLGSVDHRLRRTGPDRPVTVRGRRAMARSGDDGRRTLWLPTRVATDLGVRDGRGDRLLETPLGAERRLTIGGAEAIERTVVSRDAPIVWLEWTVDAGPAVGLELSWRVEADRAGSAWRSTDRGLMVAGRDGRRTVYAAGPEVEDWDVTEAEEGLRVRVRAALGERGFRLAVASAGRGDDLARLLRIAGRTRVAVPAREGAVNRVLAEGLTVSTPDPEVGRAVEWARARLAAGLGPVWRLDEAAAGALALLAAGEFDAVRSLLERLAPGPDGRVPDGTAGAEPTSGDGRADLLFLLLVARYLAWSGDRRGVRGIWDAVTRVADRALPTGPASPGARSGEPDGRLREAVAAELAIAAEEVGTRELAARLAGPDGAEPAAPADAGPGFGHGVGEGFGVGVDEGFDGGVGEGIGAESAVIRTVVEGLLGAEPDAPRGRLTLRPRPDGRDRFEVRGLAVGDAAVAVAYRREGSVHRLTVRQERGGAPLQLVLEPELRGQKIVASRVDGAEAGLDPRRTDDGWRVPVQLVLDQPRTLEVEFEEASS